MQNDCDVTLMTPSKATYAHGKLSDNWRAFSRTFKTSIGLHKSFVVYNHADALLGIGLNALAGLERIMFLSFDGVGRFCDCQDK